MRKRRDTELIRSTEKTGRIQAFGQFAPGRSGNPSGRPKGSRNATTLAIEALFDGEAEALTRKVIELAKTGDMQALKLCMDRLAPPRRSSPVMFELPRLKSASDAVDASAAIVAAVASGELTPSEASELSTVMQQFTRAIEAADFEARILKLEQSK
jgi:hypothetical protein